MSSFAFVPPFIYNSTGVIMDMFLGELHIEGRIHYEMGLLGWRAVNPCRFVRVTHYHPENNKERSAHGAISIDSDAQSRPHKGHPDRVRMSPWPTKTLKLES